MDHRLFGTDGIRGEAGKYPIDSKSMRLAGIAAASLVERGSKVVIGRDTRGSGAEIESALAQGLSSQGIEVYLVGHCTTPSLAFLTKNEDYDIGIMLTASHNPAKDNGVKFFGQDGFKINTEQEHVIEQGILNPKSTPSKSVKAGNVHELTDALDSYRAYALTVGPKSLQGMRIVVDCSHGGAYQIAPRVFSELKAQVTTIGVEPDGQNINSGVGSQNPAKAVEALKAHSADIAIVFDGDADRVILIDENAQEFDGDNIMLAIALELKEHGKLQKNTLVATTMSNIGLELACKDNGIRLVRTDVGDIPVVREMRAHGYNLGGEQSGHVICLDNTSTGDGLLASLQILKILKANNKSLSELRRFTPYPQIIHNITIDERIDLQKFTKTNELVTSFNGKGTYRVNMRYSGTELYLRIMVEGKDQAEIERIAQEIQTVYEQEKQALS